MEAGVHDLYLLAAEHLGQVKVSMFRGDCMKSSTSFMAARLQLQQLSSVMRPVSPCWPGAGQQQLCAARLARAPHTDLA